MHRINKSSQNKTNKKVQLFFLIVLFTLSACTSDNQALHPVTFGQFENFVKETGYVTDSEKYGWSIVQRDVYTFDRVDNATWRIPDGINAATNKNLPVTQVSYNDAIAYCEWSATRLPTYDEYWDVVKTDNRPVIANGNGKISEVKDVNVIGNVWDIVYSNKSDSVRLAGGSLFCSPNTCHGTVKQRELYVDKETANVHIGFSVVAQ